MTGIARDQLADLLRNLRSGGSFCTRRTAPVGNLTIEVRGVGPLSLPVTAAKAKELRLLAHPAKYGHGAQTILDRRVRDTWEIPRSRVKIDKRRWNNTLRPMLDTIREDLGLPATSSLKAELHSMLVYEPHQFFAPHQDSEKNDQMIGSLVVLLPSNSKGGELVVEHRGESRRYRGSASSLTFVAFYADTRHEVLPVESGYRVVLTYNLMLAGHTTPANDNAAVLAATAAELLEQHFVQTPQPRWPGDSQAQDPRDRLVFLLDYQYTERGLRWPELKGDDATRANILGQAARQADCEMALGHAEIQETWECYDSGPPPWRRGARSNWDDNPERTDLELGDLLDSTVEITPAAGEVSSFDSYVTTAELATSAPSLKLTAYDTEYTGYMGNSGNTMDRWYRRAAVVIWPKSRSLAVRAKGDPLAALHELLGSTDDPDAPQTRADDVSSLLRFWPDSVRVGNQRTLLPPALLLAWELEHENLATRLLEPFTLEAVTPADATVLLALTEQHGQPWFDQQLASWVDHRPRFASRTAPERAEWVESLPDLCTSLIDDAHASKDLKADLASALVNHLWNWLEAKISLAESIVTPSQQHAAMRDLAAPLLAVLRSTAIVDDPDLREVIVETMCDPTVQLSQLLFEVVDSSTRLPSDQLDEIGITRLARHCARTLQEALARPERAGDDWSITELEPGGCCDDCVQLATFLTDPAQQQLVWPLAKPRRQHIHRRIDEAELPVTHQTKREGSPHKLVLTKTSELFTRDAERRNSAQARLDSVKHLLGVTQAGTGSLLTRNAQTERTQHDS